MSPAERFILENNVSSFLEICPRLACHLTTSKKAHLLSFCVPSAVVSLLYEQEYKTLAPICKKW